MAEFKLSRFRYTWRGEWSSFSRYNPDDVVSYGGKVYVSLESHAANSNFYNDLNFFNNDVPPLLVPKWELMADGVSWLGDWQTDTFYNVGDIVKLGGTVYVCITGHTSVASENDFTSQIANWTVQINSQDWKIAWQENTYYKINDIVRYGGTVYRCTVSHQSSDLSQGLESSAGFWTTVSLADDWKGLWETSTRFKARDLVQYGARVYRCEVGHTSAASTTEGLEADLAKWSLIYDGIRHRGTFAQGTIYLVGDTVKYGSYLYKANTFHLSTSSIDFSYFDVYLPGQEFDADWQPLALYQPGDVVNYGGNLYYALNLNTNAVPSTDSVNWQLLFQGSRMLGDWNGLISYRLGDVVRRGGNIYACLLDHINQDPDFLNDNSTTNSTYWDLIVPGVRWRGVWQSGEFYYAGDTVVWVSSSYRCLDKHLSDSGNRPDDDPEDGSTLEGRYWAKITDGNKINRLKEVGDIRTFGDTGDGSTIGFKALTVGTQGKALTATSSGEVSWELLQNTDKVYYVAEFGEDIATAGTSPQNPWRTIRYATENITGYATIFVRTGVYDEILPIRVPPFVAIVGDELRSTEVRPANTLLSASYINYILSAAEYIQDIIGYVIREIPVGDSILAPGTAVYGTVPQNFSGTAATTNEALILDSLLNQFITRLETQNPASVNGSGSLTINTDRLNARAQVLANKSFIKNEVTLYIENVLTDSTVTNLPARFDGDLDRIIDSIYYDLGYVGNWKTIEAANYFLCASDYDINKTQNMFLLRDGTGLRNMTFTGLSGTLSGLSTLEVTQRPTAGAYASLDPGWGPSDSSAWVGTKSPYVQNVTTFGDGCVGLKIDGDLHSGGNQTIVANDFTQILSDGIGVWANGTGRTECVSVFTYYNHIGYLCTNGGKIRGTNGNCSYGQFGAVSDGFNTTEIPITASVNNRYYDATVYQVLAGDNNELLKFFFSNGGVNYTTATGTITGSGINSNVVFDEFRSGGVSEVRITDPGDSSAAGGSGYVFTTNSAQTGDATRVQIAGSDENLASNYRQMRLVLSAGTGTGQYGYIAEYDATGKYAYIGLEGQPQVTVTSSSSTGNILTTSSTSHLSVNDPVIFVGTKFGNIQDNTVYYIRTLPSGTQFTISASSGGPAFNLINGSGTMVMHRIGWQHFVEGTPIEASLNNTTNYFIEPRINFSSPGFSSTSMALPASRQWTSIAAGPNNIVAVALDSNIAVYSGDNGAAWNNGTLPATALWTKVKYVGGRFMAFATGGQAAYSTSGTSWTPMAMPSTAEWRDVAYGDGKWVAVSVGGNRAAISTDGATWSTSTLPEGADWNAIEYGKGKFVTTALSDSSTGVAIAYSTNGTSWTLGSIPQGSYALAYGNNRFVALSGGYAGATEVSTSFDGITWTESTIAAADWRAIKYAGGLFVAVANGSANMALSIDGRTWTYQSMTTSAEYCDVTYSEVVNPGRFIAIAGLVANSTVGRVVRTGRTAEARAIVVAGRISAINIWEPGSGYSSAPVMTVNDPNNSSEVATAVRLGSGVIAGPTIISGGAGFETSSTRVTITGDGYKDEYQIGTELVVSGLTRIPGPGDNVTISGIDDYIYKLLTTTILGGSLGNYLARITIAKDLGRDESPEHGTLVEIRQLYSQVRLTGHDLLDIGLGNFTETNYPDTLNPNGTVIAPENEIIERAGGRVFYTSTDQDGNFRVGELFAVEQATGTVTLNAQFFELEGLEELKLGGVTVGGSGVVIREFSTDATFTADSNNIIPTQRAIKAYLNARVSGGGADAITGQLTAGIVQIGPESLGTTTGDELIFDAKVNFRGGIDGTFLAQVYYLSASV